MLTASVAAEAVTARAAESSLSTRLDNVLSNTNPSAIDSLSEILSAITTADATLLSTISAMGTGAASGLSSEAARAEVAEILLQGNIDAEALRATAAEDLLTTLLADEETRAKAAETTLTTHLATEVTRATTAETTLTTNLATEVTRATAAETTLSSRIDQEVIDRTTANTTLSTRVTTVEGQVNGKIGQLTDLSTDAKTTIIAAINEVDAHADQNASDLQVEVTRALAAEAAVQAAASADATTKSNYALSTAENYTDEHLTIEHNARMAAEVGITTNLAAEATRATTAETTLTANLATEATRATTAETTLAANLAAESAARISADTAIRTAYNAAHFTMQSSVAATTHVVAHNLGAAFVSFTVLIERSDGTYRNDIVSVEETDSNTIKVFLTAAAKIKIAVHSMVDI